MVGGKNKTLQTTDFQTVICRYQITVSKCVCVCVLHIFRFKDFANNNMLGGFPDPQKTWYNIYLPVFTCSGNVAKSTWFTHVLCLTI